MLSLRKRVSLSASRRKIFSRHTLHQPAHFDYGLIGITALLMLFGVLFLSSATVIISFDQTHDSYAYVKQQLLHGVLPGLLLFYAASLFDYRKYLVFVGALAVTWVSLLVIVLIPGLHTDAIAHSWVKIGSITVQTSEVAKLIFIIWLSAWLSKRQHVVKNFLKTTMPFLLILALCGWLLIKQPDTGALFIYVSVAFMLLLIANARLSHIIFVLIISMAAIAPFIFSSEYRLERLFTFLSPAADTQDAGYQVRQGLIAIGSGSWFGSGIGGSQQKFRYVPEIVGDSIFSVIAEEIGFFGTTLLLCAYLALFIRGVRIAATAPDTFGCLLGFGITCMIAMQVLVNIGSMLSLLPLTGVPLPFISLGGTNIAILLASLGVLNNVSIHRILR